MTDEQASELITGELPLLPIAAVAEALRVTGRWPVLLALVHGAVRDAVREGGDPADEFAEVLTALRDEGITALDATDAARRSAAVAATIEVSLSPADPEERARYRELAVFGEDVAIPGEVVARLWGQTAGWSTFRFRRLCSRLFDLGLLAAYRRNPDRLVLHDVIRAYLRDTTRNARPAWDAAVVNGHRDLVPGGRDWADLPAEQAYLWSWLATHLCRSGRLAELEDLLVDPRWLVAKLERIGPGRTGVRPAAVRPGTVAGTGDRRAPERASLGRSRAARIASRDVRYRMPDHTGLGGLRQRILDNHSGPHLRFAVAPTTFRTPRSSVCSRPRQPGLGDRRRA